MTGRLRNLRPRWSGNGPLVSEIERDNMYALADRDKAQRRADALAAELVAVTGDLNVERGRSAAFAARLIKLRARLHMSPDEAHRNNLLLQDRLDEQRAANERLEREVARLQGHSTEPDWTGTPGWPR